MGRLWLLALWLIWAVPATAQRYITWTNPGTNAAQLLTIDPDTGDSTWSNACTLPGGTTLHDLWLARLYRWPASGGMPSIFVELDERGREGLRDSTLVPEGANYHVTFVDTTGVNESCPSNRLYIGPVTGVTPTPHELASPGTKMWFDLRGRRVNPPLVSGIYWIVEVKNGRRMGKAIKTVIVK